MLFILRQFIHPSFLFCEARMTPSDYKYSVIEEYFEWGKNLTWLQYNKWGVFLNWNKRIDCSWLPIIFWGIKWYRNKDKKRMHTNSYKLFLLGKKKKSYFNIERWDTIFFLPNWTWSYHIAFAVWPVKNNTLRIFDFFSKVKQWKMSERNLKLRKCWWSYCYMKRKILVRTNIFKEQEKNK